VTMPAGGFRRCTRTIILKCQIGAGSLKCGFLQDSQLRRLVRFPTSNRIKRWSARTTVDNG